MKPGLWVLFLFQLAIFGGCVDSNPPAEVKPHVDPHQLTTEAACKTLLVVMEDRSGSTDVHRKFTLEDYEQLLRHFVQKHAGVVAVRVIGNVPLSDRDFFRFEVPPAYDHKPMPPDATLSEKAAVNNQNKAITALNDSLQQAAMDNIGQWLELIREKVIEYRPQGGKDMTDVVEALEHLNDILHEQVFKNYDNVVVVLFSDGVHDIDGRTLQGVLKIDRPLELVLLGWKDESIFSGASHIIRFEAKDGFLSWWRNYKCSKKKN